MLKARLTSPHTVGREGGLIPPCVRPWGFGSVRRVSEGHSSTIFLFLFICGERGEGIVCGN